MPEGYPTDCSLGEPFALVERSAAMDLVESVNAIVLG